MPFRSMSTLQSWLEEFQSLGYPVVFQLANAPTLAYLQPDMSALEWLVTMEAREAPSTMNPATVMNLAFELSVLSALGAFLQTKSRDFMRHSTA
jgi:hypothetical protein